MSTHTTSVLPALNQVPEDSITSQGGGHDTATTPFQSPPPGPVARNNASSHKPRPVSMPPPLPYNTTPGSATTSSSDTKDRPRGPSGDRRQHRDASSSRPSRSNRILGDYTLSKTLGAGSMGKVKLATHNITGEKVHIRLISLSSTFNFFL